MCVKTEEGCCQEQYFNQSKKLINPFYLTISKKIIKKSRAVTNMNDLDKIFSYYDKFHEKFLGDVKSLNCGDICSKCKDNCEVCAKDEDIPFKYVCVFLPHELEYVASRMKIDIDEFKNKYAYGIDTGAQIINVLKFERECPFLNDDFTCRMGETKIISCKIYPIIHYPLIGFNLSGHCDLVKDVKIKDLFMKGIKEYEILLKELDYDIEYKYLRESLDILQIDAKKAKKLLSSSTYDIIDVEEFKKLLLAETAFI
jgi:hypothetical protein